MDELVSKLGITIRYGPEYSPWSNETDDTNHASGDIKIRKILEENKQKLTDVIIKTAAFTHNTSVNKAGFSPLQLIIGKATKIPELTMGIKYSKNLIDAKVNDKIMETRSKITQLFREAEPKKRLKDYQKIPIRTGDKIEFQHNDARHDPAETVNQKGNTILAYFNEEM